MDGDNGPNLVELVCLKQIAGRSSVAEVQAALRNSLKQVGITIGKVLCNLL
jgi:hypothetical protein